MHILIISSEFPTNENPNAGIFVFEQAKALARVGIKVGVIYPDQQAPTSLSVLTKLFSISEMEKENINVLIDNGVLIPKCTRYLIRKRGEILFKRYKEKFGKPDLLHAHFAIWAGDLANYLSKKWNIPYFITEHASAYFRNIYSSKKLQIANEAFRNSSKNIVVSEFLADTINNKIEKKVNFEIIPNFVADTMFTKEIGKRNDSDVFRFFAPSNLVSNKSVDVIIKAFTRLKGNVELVIGGDGPEKKALKDLASSLNISNRVKFEGLMTRDQVSKQMSQSDAFVHASIVETFGIVLIEAMASGLPVICSKCGAPENIIDEKNGILFDVGDIDALTKAMESMVSNINEYDNHLIQNDVKSKYSEKSIVNKLSNLYRQFEKN